MKKPSFQFAAAFCVLGLLSLAKGTEAWAYIPPSHFLIKTLASKHQGFRTLRVRTTVAGMDGDKSTGVFFKAQTWVDIPGDMIRSRALDDSGKVLYAVERKLSSAAGSSSLAAMVNSLIYDSNVETVSRLLKEGGIAVRGENEKQDLDVTALGRWKNQIAWILGTGKKPITKPQLWLEKDVFLPLRLIGKADGDLYDVQFESFRFYREFPYPRMVNLVKISGEEEKTLLREELSEILVNSDLSEVKTGFSTGYTELGNQAAGQVRDLIRLYYGFLH